MHNAHDFYNGHRLTVVDYPLYVYKQPIKGAGDLGFPLALLTVGPVKFVFVVIVICLLIYLKHLYLCLI
jgi:hypothetical protein